MRIVLAFNIIIPELCNVGEFTGRHIVGDENCARLKHNHAYIVHGGQVQWRMPIFIPTLLLLMHCTLFECWIYCVRNLRAQSSMSPWLE